MTSYLQSTFDFDSDELIEVIDELPFWSAPFGIKLLEHIRLKRNITALDIGFGAGFPLTELAMRLGSSSRIYGIDPWEAATKRAQKKIDFYGIRNIELIIGEAEEMSFQDNSIDLITSNNGINNVSNLSKTIQECARILKPDGQFVQTVNLEESMMEFYDILNEVLLQYGFKEEANNIQQHIYEKRKPLDEFTQLIETSGFSINNTIHDQFEYNYIDGSTMLNHYFIRLAFLPSWKELVPKHKLKAIFNEVETRMNKIASEEGSFKLSVPFVLIDSEKK